MKKIINEQGLEEQEAGTRNQSVVKQPGTLLLKILLPVVIIFVAILYYSYLKATKPKMPPQAKVETAWPVRVIQAEIKDYQPRLQLYGEIISGRKVELRALVAGEIREVGEALRSGGIVKKGDSLLKVDSFQYEGALTDAKARLDEAKAKLQEIEATLAQEQKELVFEQVQFDLAQKDLERAIPLAEKGTISKKAVDDRRVIASQREQLVIKRKNNFKIQQARLDQQKATLDRLAWGGTQAERNLRDTNLVAPFDAYVSDVAAEAGRIVGVNDRVATLLDRNWMEVKFSLSDQQFGRIMSSGDPLIGRSVRVFWRVGSTPFVYEASVERLGPQISSNSGGVDVYARLADPLKGTPIRSGAFVEVEVPDRIYRQTVKVPQTALFGSSYVFLVEKDRLTRRKVELIGSDGNDLLLRGDLKTGDQILVTRLSFAGEGVQVKILKEEGVRSAPEAQKSGS